jgi:SprT protein
LARSSSGLRKEKAASTRLPEQLELRFANTETLTSILSLRERRTRTSPGEGGSIGFRFLRDVDLELKARELLRGHGAGRIANEVRVKWNARLKSCAGRADFRRKLISLNPRLREHGPAEIDRTLRHELAHLLAQFRAGRKRILPHGEEWRAACRDLGIGDEARCHSLPFPIRERALRFLYKCPSCQRKFPRVRKIRRAIACLACCRAHSRGKFDARFRLLFVT